MHYSHKLLPLSLTLLLAACSSQPEQLPHLPNQSSRKTPGHRDPAGYRRHPAPRTPERQR